MDVMTYSVFNSFLILIILSYLLTKSFFFPFPYAHDYVYIVSPSEHRMYLFIY